MENEKHRQAKINSETNSGSFPAWLVLLMGKAILRQQFRNNAFSPTKEAKREMLEDWLKLADRLGRARFCEGLLEAFLHTTFIPSCEDIQQYAPTEEPAMYRPFPVLEPPKDPVTAEQIEEMTQKLRDIAEGKVMVKTATKDVHREELHEKISKGMRVQVVDRKGAAANDK